MSGIHQLETSFFGRFQYPVPVIQETSKLIARAISGYWEFVMLILD